MLMIVAIEAQRPVLIIRTSDDKNRMALREFMGQMTLPMGLLAILATAAASRVFKTIFSRW
jgi:hypothetical protein